MESQDQHAVINHAESAKSSLFSRFKKRKKLVIVLLLIILAWLGLYMVTLFVDKPDNKTPSASPKPQATSSPVSDVVIDKSDWQENSESYYSFSYPPEAEIQRFPNLTRIIIKGENQKEGVEYHDAVFLEFHVKQLEGRNLQQAAMDEFNSVKEAPAQEIIEELKEIELLDNQGYFFSERGLVVLDHYFLLLNQDLYLEIVDASDGGQAIPFEVLAQEIIETLEY